MRLIQAGELTCLRRVYMNDSLFLPRIGLPHSNLAETDRQACIIPLASRGIRS
jgi:hypothetical protein